MGLTHPIIVLTENLYHAVTLNASIFWIRGFGHDRVIDKIRTRIIATWNKDNTIRIVRGKYCSNFGALHADFNIFFGKNFSTNVPMTFESIQERANSEGTLIDKVSYNIIYLFTRQTPLFTKFVQCFIGNFKTCNRIVLHFIRTHTVNAEGVKCH